MRKEYEGLSPFEAVTIGFLILITLLVVGCLIFQTNPLLLFQKMNEAMSSGSIMQKLDRDAYQVFGDGYKYFEDKKPLLLAFLSIPFSMLLLHFAKE